MHYEINVSRHGRHVFATHPRSITSRAELIVMLPMLRARFPASEGFEVDATLHEQTARTISDADLT